MPHQVPAINSTKVPNLPSCRPRKQVPHALAPPKGARFRDGLRCASAISGPDFAVFRPFPQPGTPIPAIGTLHPVAGCRWSRNRVPFIL